MTTRAEIRYPRSIRPIDFKPIRGHLLRNQDPNIVNMVVYSGRSIGVAFLGEDDRDSIGALVIRDHEIGYATVDIGYSLEEYRLGDPYLRAIVRSTVVEPNEEQYIELEFGATISVVYRPKKLIGRVPPSGRRRRYRR